MVCISKYFLSVVHCSPSQDSLLPVRRHRAKSLEDTQIRAALRQHHVSHRGSVRGTFTRSTDSKLLRRVWKLINEIGRDKRDYSLFVFHKSNVVRKRVKRIAKSRWSSCVGLCDTNFIPQLSCSFGVIECNYCKYLSGFHSGLLFPSPPESLKAPLWLVRLFQKAKFPFSRNLVSSIRLADVHLLGQFIKT